MIWIWFSVICLSIGGLQFKNIEKCKKKLLVYSYLYLLFFLSILFISLNKITIYDTKDLVEKNNTN